MIIALSRAEFAHADKISAHRPIRHLVAAHIAPGELLKHCFTVLGLDSPNRSADIMIWPLFVTV